jgi:WD40 repeat protein
VLLLVVGTAALLGEDGAKPRPDPSALRMVTQRGHLYMTSVAVSPNGALCISGASYDPVAVLWDLATGQELRRFEGHTRQVVTTLFMPSGDEVVTASRDGTARLWSIATGNELKVFENRGVAIRSAALTRDGSLMVLGGRDGTVSFWALGNRSAPASIRAQKDTVRVAVSPDSSLVLTGGWDGTVTLHTIETGAELLRIDAHEGAIVSVAFSPDQKHFLTAGRDAVARLWSVRTGAEEKVFRGHGSSILAARFSPDGRMVVTGSGEGIWGEGTTLDLENADNTVRLWDVATGDELRRFVGHEDAVRGVDFSANGSRILTNGRDSTIRLWDARSGKLIRRIRGSSHPLWGIAAGSNSARFLTTGVAGTAHVWDIPAGRIRGTLVCPSSSVLAVALSHDGQQAITGELVGPARLWDVASGSEVRRFEGHTDALDAVTFSPSGEQVATGSRDGSARIWDTSTGAEVRRFECSGWVTKLLFSPDGAQIAIGTLTEDKDRLQLIDAENGRPLLSRPGVPLCFSPDGESLAVGHEAVVEIVPLGGTGATRRLVGHPSRITCGSFSADGRTLISGSSDGEIRAWDAAEGQETTKFSGHGWVKSLVVPAHGRWFASGSSDGFLRFWSLATGKELCRLIGFRDGNWGAMDPDGRYDASNGGDIEGMHWVVDNEPISLDQLKDRYYEPGLLAKVLGFNKEPLRDVKAFTAPKLYPAVKLSHKDGKLNIKLTNRGGGIGKVVVMVNGKERVADARGPKPDANAKELTLDEDLSDDPRLLPGEDNRVEVFAYNAEGYLRSRGFRFDFKVEGRRQVPHLWAVVAGVSDYGGEQIDLRFAAKDAEDFAKALGVASARFLGAERTYVTHLPNVKRKELLDALAGIRATSSDILVLYLAGHGVNHNDQFFYLTADARTANLQDPALRKTTAISSAELTAAINASPALKQVLILDTCASGKLVKDLGLKRSIPSSQVRALERVKDRTGMFVLAGCAADKVSYEATRYGQGLLTYSLLLGMKAGKLRDEQYVDVSTLFNFAADKVPQFARDIGGVQRPIVAQPRGGGSFDIGRLTDDDRNGLELRSVRPLFTRSRFFDRAEDDDVHNLAREVDALLKEHSAGRDARLNFVDAREAADAYRIAGSYTTRGDTVHVRFRVRGKTDSEFITVGGQASDLANLACRILAEVRQHVR